MRIVFISPPNKIDPQVDHFRCGPQSAAAVFAAVLLPHHDFTYVDLAPRVPPLKIGGVYLAEEDLQFDIRMKEAVERFIPMADVFLISNLYTYQWPQVLSLVHFLKKRFPEGKFLLGGRHVTGDSQRALMESNCDAVVLGSGEKILPRLISGIESCGCIPSSPHVLVKGQSVRNDVLSVAPLPDPSTIPLPRYEVFDKTIYNYQNFHTGALRGAAAADIFTSQGCNGVCRFCTTPTMAPSWRPKTLQMISTELETLKALGYDELIIEDDNILLKKERAFEVFQLLHDFGFTWSLVGGIERTRLDNEVAERLVETGCWRIHLSVESCNTEVISGQGKWLGAEPSQLAVRQVVLEKLSLAGMEIFIDFVIGFPDQSIQSMWESADFGKELVNDYGASMALFHCATPFPGTLFYRDVIAKGYLLNPFDYARYTFAKGSISCAAFEPDELTELRLRFLEHANGIELMRKDRDRLQRPDPRTSSSELKRNAQFKQPMDLHVRPS
jgi:radical SAM superfamily enzyme YgiQ (UPF0313 family)